MGKRAGGRWWVGMHPCERVYVHVSVAEIYVSLCVRARRTSEAIWRDSMRVCALCLCVRAPCAVCACRCVVDLVVVLDVDPARQNC